MRILRLQREFENEAKRSARGEQCSDEDRRKRRARCARRDDVHHTFAVYRVRQAYHSSKDQARCVSPYLPGRRRYSYIAQLRCDSDPVATAIRNEIISVILETPGVWEGRKKLRARSMRLVPVSSAIRGCQRPQKVVREEKKITGLLHEPAVQ